MARSAIVAMPSRSMSFIVKTCTPDARILPFSFSSRLRMPTSTVCAGDTDGDDPIDASSCRLLAEQGRQRHPVHVAGGGRLRRVHVAVRVHPDQAERIRRHAANVVGARGHRAGGQAVIAAEHQRQRACLVRLQRDVVQAAAHGGDLVDVLLRRIDGLCRLGNRRGQIALIADRRTRARAIRSPRPAMRNADGPMSTPRRAPPRSRGTPMM